MRVPHLDRVLVAVVVRRGQRLGHVEEGQVGELVGEDPIDVVAGQYVETDAGRYVGPPEKH